MLPIDTFWPTGDPGFTAWYVRQHVFPGAILVLHSPPQGHCDANGGGDHFGSAALLRAVEEKRPRLAVGGHIHESWGCQSQIGETPLHNLGPKGTWLEA